MNLEVRAGSQEEELELIEKAKAEPEAFRALYDKYYEQIFRFLYQKLEEEDLTADITSSVFLKAILNLKSYKYQGFSFGAWLYKIAFNELHLHFREHKRKRNVLISSEFFDTFDSSGNEEKQTLLDKLAKAIQTLREEEVQLIELKFWEKKSHQEIAYILDLSLPNVKVKMHRLYRKLENIIKKNSL